MRNWTNGPAARLAATALAIAAVAPLARAEAATQTIDATIDSSVSMDSNPSGSVPNWILSATGANTTSGGSVGVVANRSYTVTVVADRAVMAEYDTETNSYVEDGQTLTTGLAIVPVKSAGSGVPLAVTVGTTPMTLATGVGKDSDAYALTLSQATAITDSALPAGRVYRMTLTYTTTAA